jgi:hypothetical protein
MFMPPVAPGQPIQKITSNAHRHLAVSALILTLTCEGGGQKKINYSYTPPKNGARSVYLKNALIANKAAHEKIFSRSSRLAWELA